MKDILPQQIEDQQANESWSRTPTTICDDIFLGPRVSKLALYYSRYMFDEYSRNDETFFIVFADLVTLAAGPTFSQTINHVPLGLSARRF